MSPDELRVALQQFLDGFGDGWQVDHFVIAFGLERMGDDGIESAPWVWAPLEQPGYITAGLLDAAMDCSSADVED